MNNNWQTKKLEDVCEKITDGTHQTPKYFNDGNIFLSSKNVSSGKIDWQNIKYIDQKQHMEMQKRVSPRRNDILLAKNGTTGVAAIVDKDITFDIYVSLALLRPTKLVSPTFLLYFINSPVAKQQFNKRLKGVGVPNLHLEEIRKVSLSFPESLEEQKRIVRILDEVFEKIEMAKENTEKNLQNSRELFGAYLYDIFNYHGKSWQSITLGEIVKTTQGIQIPKNLQKFTRQKGYIRYLYISDFDHDKYLKYVEDKYPTKIVTDNDLIVVNTGASAGKIYRGVDGVLSNNLFKVSFDTQVLDREFLYYFVTSPIFKNFQKKIIRGTANPHMGHENFNSTPFSLPEISEQRKIAKDLNILQQKTKNLENIYDNKIANLEELKKAVLNKAFAREL